MVEAGTPVYHTVMLLTTNTIVHNIKNGLKLWDQSISMMTISHQSFAKRKSTIHNIVKILVHRWD